MIVKPTRRQTEELFRDRLRTPEERFQRYKRRYAQRPQMLSVVNSTPFNIPFSTTQNVTIAAPTIGNGLIVFVQSNGPALVASITHGADVFVMDAALGNNTVQLWSCPSTASTSTTLVINLNAGGDQGNLVVVEVAGGRATNWYDTGAGVDVSYFTLTTITAGPSNTLATPNEIVFGMFENNAGATGTWTATSPAVTCADSSGSGTQLHVQYQIVAATTAVSPACTHSTSVSGQAAVVAYIASGQDTVNQQLQYQLN